MRRTLLASALLCSSLIAGAIWLTASDSGLQTALHLARQAGAGRLTVEQASGRLLGRLEIGSLSWQTPELQLHAEQIHLDWSPMALLHGRLEIAELSLGQLHIGKAPSSQPSVAPTTLPLPLTVNVKKMAISRFEYGHAFTAENLSGQFTSDGRQHRLSDLQIESGGATLRGQATLDGTAPLALDASARINAKIGDPPAAQALALDLEARGPLAQIALAITARQGIAGQAQIALTPFAPSIFANAKIALDNLDPAAWQAGAPTAHLNLRADLGPKDDGIAGSFSISNSQPGPLDRQRLPLDSLAGQLAWQGGTAQFNALKLTLHGSGELTGRAEWADDRLQLDLNARRLDAGKIHTMLRSTRLNGPISARLNAQQQDLKLDLKDRRFSLLAEASHAGQRLTLPRLEIGAGAARLSASGELALDQDMAFKTAGKLSRFDPSQFFAPSQPFAPSPFAALPTARLNARFSAQGKLAPRPLITASFALEDSQMAGQPLTGRGRLNVDWPRIPQADIALSAGRNRLTARGAFGQPGDRLKIDLDAPQLSPYGLNGDLSGRLELAGSVAQPQLSARLHAAQLGLPEVGRLRGLSLSADIANQANAPLRLELNIAQLGTPAQPALAKALRLSAEGSNRAHRLRGSVELPDQTQFRLALEGGLQPLAGQTKWQGRLLEAELNSADKTRNFQLTAPAALNLAATGWSFGPAQLAGKPLDWAATVQAAADARQLHARLDAKGSRIGRVDGQFTAGMLGPWSLNRTAAWQGSLNADITDLAWLAELIGEQWQSAGRFSGQLKLAGTPAQPLASGRFRGEKLALRLAGQGLDLANGELAIDLDDNRLRIRQLNFDSLFQAMPRRLRLRDQAAMAKLTERPGRLEISGEIRVDRSATGEHAWLDYRLDRLGAFQLTDQWIMLSGTGRLTWQGDTLGAKGKLAVDAGYWQLAPADAPRLSADVVIKRPGDAAQPSKLRPKLDLDISTELGRNFLFDGAGLASRLVGDIRLRASGRDLPRASGNIRTRDGRFDAYGQQLSLKRGILTFQGLLDNPALDVIAVRQGLAVEPGVQISGTAQRPVIKLISDPSLPDAEKLAWLILGHGPEQMGAGDATLLLSAAGGLLGNNSGGVIQTLKRQFGIDEFAVRQGDIGSSGVRQPGSRIAGSRVDTTASTGNQIVSVGKRLSSNAVLSYEQSIGKAEGIVKLTVNLSRQIAVIGRAGSDNALDIFYTITFGSPPRRTRPAQSRPAASPD